MNRRGPSTEPWGTPVVTGNDLKVLICSGSCSAFDTIVSGATAFHRVIFKCAGIVIDQVYFEPKSTSTCRFKTYETCATQTALLVSVFAADDEPAAAVCFQSDTRASAASRPAPSLVQSYQTQLPFVSQSSSPSWENCCDIKCFQHFMLFCWVEQMEAVGGLMWPLMHGKKLNKLSFQPFLNI